MISCDVTGGLTLGTKLKTPIFPFFLFWYFRSLCIRDTVSNKTYQNFRDKRLVRPKSKYPIWQRSRPISYKDKFSQRDNIYLVDFKYDITYQNIPEELRSDQFLCPEKPKMTKKWSKQLHMLCMFKTLFFSVFWKMKRSYLPFFDIVYLCRCRLFGYLCFLTLS